MRDRLARAVGSSFPLLFVVGCAAEPPGTHFAVNVSPLTLPGLTDACYRLAVYDGDPDAGGALVWSQEEICASRYGNGPGGDITYIGTCSAQPDGRINHIRLAIEDLYRAGVAPTGTPLDSDTWENPCPVGDACELQAACRENADTLVEFNLVVMRDAQQGFFDIAVNFEDIFCSAKLDCVDELLYRPGGARDDTAVVGFACTSGGEDATHLYLGDYIITCNGQPVVQFDPEAGPGQHGPQGTGSFQSAIYQGLQAFEADETCYWNGAIGLDLAALTGDCTLSVRGTAGTHLFAGGDGAWHTPANAIYPVIDWTVPLTVGGVRVCGTNPLNGDESGVVTDYTDFSGESFANHYACGAPVVVPPNEPPALVDLLTSYGVQQGATDSWSFAAGAFIDPEGGPLSYSARIEGGGALPGWLAFDPGTRTFTATAPPSPTSLMIEVVASDTLGATGSASFQLDVTQAPNVDPVLTNPLGPVTLAEGESRTFDLTSYVTDGNGDTLSFQINDGPSWAYVSGNDLVINTIFAGDAFATAGNYVLSFFASDQIGTPLQVDVTVEVTNVNRLTAIPTFGSMDVPEDGATDLELSNYFSDPDGDALTYTLVAAPNWMHVSGSLLVWDHPTQADVGPYTATLEISDGGVGSPVTLDLSGNVTPSNDGPLAGQPNPYVFNRSTTSPPHTFYYYMEGFFMDPEGDDFTLEFFDLPSWLVRSDVNTELPDPTSFWLMGDTSTPGTYEFSAIPTDVYGAVGEPHYFIVNVSP